MIMCPKCGKVLEDGMRFCDNCGAQIPKTAVCPNCGERVISGYAFCQKCGTPVGQAPNFGAGYVPAPGTGYTPDPNAGYVPAPGTGYAPNPGTGYAPTPGTGYASDPTAGYTAGYPGPAATAVQQKKKGIPKKALIFGGIGVAAVAVIIAAVALIVNLLGGGSKTSDKTYMFYLRDREIVYFDLKSGDKLEVTSRLLNGGSMSDSNLANGAYGLGYYIAFNEDGSRVFYPDRTNFDNAEGITLYYRNMNKPDEEPVKIDSDITKYAINKEGTVVIYSKGFDGILYKHDLTNKEKIASNVEGFEVTDDCSKVMYLTDDSSIYLWYADKDKAKIASDVSAVYYVSEDLSVIYYTKQDSSDSYTYSLYKQTVGADERVKIASDVYYIVNIYDSGELYYVKSENVEISLMDYVNDDLAASDAAITEPEYPTAPQSHYWYYSNSNNTYYYYDPGYGYRYFTEAEYNAIIEQYYADYSAYQAALDEYNKAQDAYRDKVSRDYLRESLKGSTIERAKYILYYYNGTDETVVTDALTAPWSVTWAADAATLLLPAYNQSEVTKVRISEISSVYDFHDQVNQALYSSSERYIAVKATLTLLDQPDASHFTMSSDGSTIYFLDDITDSSGDEKGDLYKITIADGQAGRPELYDSDVSTTQMYLLTDNRFAYFKDVDISNWKGDLYINKAEVDYDVSLYSFSYTDNAVFYYTDWNSSKDYGTLKKYENGEKTKIADDVHSFVTTDDNDILYLYDYSSNYYKGTLYRYNQGEPVKIDDDVMALIPVSGGRVKGYSAW